MNALKPIEATSFNIELYARLADALNDIKAASSATALWVRVKRFAGCLNYSYLTAADASRMAAGPDNAFLYSDLPPSALAAIGGEDLTKTHPVLRRCMEGRTPFKVSELRDRADQAGALWTQLLADVVKKGDALIVPVYDASGLRAIFSFGGHHPDLSPQAEAIMQTLAYAAFAKAGALNGPRAPRDSILTVRETQCLQLIAAGKSDGQAAEILGVSSRTIRFHLDGAKSKLGASTRAHAVATAMTENLIGSVAHRSNGDSKSPPPTSPS
jgi:DNA-binding CsgD family transcriptional regulator